MTYKKTHHFFIIAILFAITSLKAILSPISSYAINVISTKLLFELKGSPAIKFEQPTNVALGKDKRIYVIDGVNNRVVYFDKNGGFLGEFGSQGSEEGKFKFPLGIKTDKDGNVYVADSGNGRMQIFDPNGKYLKVFNLERAKRGDNWIPADPTDIAINEKLNKCYIVDNDNHRILTYTKDGKYLSKFGELGLLTVDFFRYPYKVELDSVGNYYVLEVINTRVQVFDESSNFKYTIGEWGLDKGQFFRPQGLAIDKKDRVFISDNYTGVVQVLTNDSAFIGAIGDENGKILRFDTPSGLCVDENDRLYVVQMLKNTVSVYQIQWR